MKQNVKPPPQIFYYIYAYDLVRKIFRWEVVLNALWTEIYEPYYSENTLISCKRCYHLKNKQIIFIEYVSNSAVDRCNEPIIWGHLPSIKICK